MRAFISYHHEDRHIAGDVSQVLINCGIDTFMAHEDIDVSEEWRLVILRELQRTDLFVAVLSARYSASSWCVQEAGIAAFRQLTCIPLSIDRTIPLGFMAHVQAAPLIPGNVSLVDLVPGFAKHNIEWAMNILITYVCAAADFRGAEARFRVLLPYQERLTEEQGLRLLDGCYKNTQIHHAGQCAREYLPIFVEQYGQNFYSEKYRFLADRINEYRDYADMEAWLPGWAF